MAGDGLAVTTAGAVEVVDRQALLAVGAAIAILAADGVGTSALCAFEHAAEQILGALRRVQPVTLPEIEQLTDLFLTLLHPLP
ncbi:hypothetical protein [Agrobacterium pusense]|uniref:hypothetical protein n=1 Tax=Agrobacterium pusense TaxID=648995 RepID=UPI00080F352B|nr:hypothetical protein [Agrobacterium pusense]ANV26267.1 hypothetical protein BA939_20165 [Rhizobium sp. S41]